MRYELTIYLPPGNRAAAFNLIDFQNIGYPHLNNVRIGVACNFFNFTVRIIEAKGHIRTINWNHNRAQLEPAYVWSSQRVKSNFSCGYDYDSSLSLGFCADSFERMTIRALDVEPNERPVLARRLDHFGRTPQNKDPRFESIYQFKPIESDPIEINKPREFKYGDKQKYAFSPMNLIFDDYAGQPADGNYYESMRLEFLTRMSQMIGRGLHMKTCLLPDEFTRLSVPRARAVIDQIHMSVVGLDFETHKLYGALKNSLQLVEHRREGSLEERAIRKNNEFARKGNFYGLGRRAGTEVVELDPRTGCMRTVSTPAKRKLDERADKLMPPGKSKKLAPEYDPKPTPAPLVATAPELAAAPQEAKAIQFQRGLFPIWVTRIADMPPVLVPIVPPPVVMPEVIPEPPPQYVPQHAPVYVPPVYVPPMMATPLPTLPIITAVRGSAELPIVVPQSPQQGIVDIDPGDEKAFALMDLFEPLPYEQSEFDDVLEAIEKREHRWENLWQTYDLA